MESKVKYGQEIGPNLIRVGKKLLQNQELLMLLENTDLDPTNKDKHPNIIDGKTLLHKLIRFVPILDAAEQSTKSKLVLMYNNGTVPSSNSDNENLTLNIIVFCPFKEWLIAGDSLRPFAIMSEVRKSIQDKRINGLGEIVYEGFSVSTITEEMGSYTMHFRINAFS